MKSPHAPSTLVDLAALHGVGPLWGLDSEDLNATLLAWDSGQGIAEHVNDERDVLIVVLGGEGEVIVDGRADRVRAGHAILVARGCRRAINAGPSGLRYLSIHRRRGPLQIAPEADTGGSPA